MTSASAGKPALGEPQPPPTHLVFSLHLLVLWSFAIAEPLYQVLGRNREFYVAHRVSPIDLLLFMALVSLLLPVALALCAAAIVGLIPRIAAYVRLTMVGLLIAAIASEVLSKSATLPGAPHIVLSLIVGAAVAWLYGQQPLARTFLTVLGPSVVVFPALVLIEPSMAAFVRPADQSQSAAATLGASRPPIVVVVFDQLPVTSLMADNDRIDTTLYPGFGALAADATWYRNASTVAEITGWAIPPILTGVRPRPNALPTSRDYPNNLFTLVGNGYHYEVEEPITDLCPDRLCDADLDPWPQRLANTTLDASVVFLHVVLPDDLRQILPPLSQDWKNFIQSQHWSRRWVSERDLDRRDGPRGFIAGISASDAQPTLYYLHALLPHEPYIYLRSGQQFTDSGDVAGLTSTGRWVDDPWPVLQAYRHHLLQMQFVDSLVGGLVARLRREGLWDRALVVITADHGVSFRPGHPFKGLDQETLADIMTVPLFVKLPGQHGATISDRNVQSVDIVPTIADVLHVALSWDTDGHSVLAHDAPTDAKRIQHMGATRSVDIDMATLVRLRQQAVHRRVTLFRGADEDFVPEESVHRELIGHPLTSLSLVDVDPSRAKLNYAPRYQALDPADDLVPALLTGSVIDDHGDPRQAGLAVAVNGVVRATTRTYNARDPHPGTWSAFVHPRYFHKGSNDIEVFLIDDRGGQVHLDRAYSPADTAAPPASH
jgi:hypothetical protein